MNKTIEKINKRYELNLSRGEIECLRIIEIVKMLHTNTLHLSRTNINSNGYHLIDQLDDKLFIKLNSIS